LPRFDTAGVRHEESHHKRIPYAPRYYAQSHAETAFARFKRTFGGGLRAKQEESQEREASLACQLLNRMLERGCPQSYPVS
jgi:hypothetical protein